MKLGGGEKKAVQKLSDAVNTAVESSPDVLDAIENLRSLGFESDLSIRLEIGLKELGEDRKKPNEEVTLELSEDDLLELRRMKIKVD
ncbi:MAG: hypothetical protein R2681_08105 [Pyrinomonadaceae bacterium]